MALVGAGRLRASGGVRDAASREAGGLAPPASSPKDPPFRTPAQDRAAACRGAGGSGRRRLRAQAESRLSAPEWRLTW